ncbi:hypothetical protein PMIN06_006147 [Paraphaeosphaeria minitans]
MPAFNLPLAALRNLPASLLIGRSSRIKVCTTLCLFSQHDTIIHPVLYPTYFPHGHALARPSTISRYLVFTRNPCVEIFTWQPFPEYMLPNRSIISGLSPYEVVPPSSDAVDFKWPGRPQPHT